MSTYLKNMAGHKHNHLKNKSFNDIQKLFDKAMKRVNTFVDMDTELVEGSEERIEKTKRSKNDQKPTRNGKKTKSQEQDKEISQKSQPDQPDTVKLSQR
ncbi:hypothetical protein Tco_0975510 [Tanacetum coccineum]|uniref:Uncharacterized protein n=1 Tax=Tanacetum coccineum TaxID=301880 RepID=A0ABQ5EEJ1_9ASTR